jgi:hypothetical protein
MAVINQSPTGQASVALSGTSFNDIAASATPFWQSRKIVQGVSVAVSSVTIKPLIKASLIGRNTDLSSLAASGVFSLGDQIAAKRADAWPLQ